MILWTRDFSWQAVNDLHLVPYIKMQKLFVPSHTHELKPDFSRGC